MKIIIVTILSVGSERVIVSHAPPKVDAPARHSIYQFSTKNHNFFEGPPWLRALRLSNTGLPSGPEKRCELRRRI